MQCFARSPVSSSFCFIGPQPDVLSAFGCRRNRMPQNTTCLAAVSRVRFCRLLVVIIQDNIISLFHSVRRLKTHLLHKSFPSWWFFWFHLDCLQGLNPLTPTVVIRLQRLWASECPNVKIANDCLTRSVAGCFIAVPISQQWASKGIQTALVDYWLFVSSFIFVLVRVLD